MSANPNNTQIQPQTEVKAPSQPADNSAQIMTDNPSGYPYVASSGADPKPANIHPRYGLATAGRVPNQDKTDPFGGQPQHHKHKDDEPLPPPKGGFEKADERYHSDDDDSQETGTGGRANVLDKVVGKAQKVIGEKTGNWELHGKGELRESGASKS